MREALRDAIRFPHLFIDLDRARVVGCVGREAGHLEQYLVGLRLALLGIVVLGRFLVRLESRRRVALRLIELANVLLNLSCGGEAPQLDVDLRRGGRWRRGRGA